MVDASCLVYWGYPEKFVARAQRHGSSVYLWIKHAPIGDVPELPHGVGLVTGDVSGARELVRELKAGGPFNIRCQLSNQTGK